MEQDWTLPGVTKSDIGAPEPVKQKRAPIFGRLLIFVVGLVAILAIAATAWIYTDTKREILRLSTDIAQLRLSLDLYSRQQPGSASAASGAATAPSDELLNLQNRLAILENNWRTQTPTNGATSALPALPATAAPASTVASGADCMPPGTRFLVTTGDSYPICGTSGVVNVGAVGTTDVSLTDGTIIVAGTNAPLSGTTCTLSLMSANADGMTGYAELRASC